MYMYSGQFHISAVVDLYKTNSGISCQPKFFAFTIEFLQIVVTTLILKRQ